MKVDLIITNAHVLCMDNAYTEFENGSIAIRDGKIIDVYSGVKEYEAEKQIDASGHVVLPGFVNTHTHAAMTIYRGLGDDKALMDWLQNYIWPAEAQFGTNDSVRLGTELAVIEMIQSGTTTFNDMYFFQDTVGEICEKYGMRVMLGEGILNFPTPSIQDPSTTFSYVEQLIQKWSDSDIVNCAVSPHAPYTVDRDRLLQAKELSKKYDLPYHIHLSETAFEVEESIKKEGKSPVAYLNEIGVLDHKTVAAHCVHLSEEDMDIMKQADACVSHNPQSNLKLASGIAPIHKYLDKGIRVGIGTDGTASNNNLNMIKEMDVAAKLQKGISFDASVMDAKSTIRMSTLGGAEVLGLDKEIGSIEIGKKADVIAINMDFPHLTPLFDPYSHIVYASNGNEVNHVVINGQLVLENGALKKIDVKRVNAEVNELSKEIKARFY